jgi:23S rRNA (adenine2503-C2)-methyltransferase
VKSDSEHPFILSGLEPEEITTLLNNEPSYRALQIFQWIHREIGSFKAMSNIPTQLRSTLEKQCILRGSHPAEVLRSHDGTVKYRITLGDEYSVESVLLTDSQGRKTACLSTQVGCAMGCTFCRTGSRGLKRNLTASEIVEQYHHLLSEGGTISNIVFMGMGEPFMNTGPLYKAIRILTHWEGPALSPRRITVSTCGIASKLHTLVEEAPGVRLAVSLPSADPVKRRKLMPGASTYSLSDLKESLKAHQAASGDRITIETVLFSGVNTAREDARELVSFAEGLRVVINVIPFNPFEEALFREPSEDEARKYIDVLEKEGLKVTRRYRRGRGILGACGQLTT